MSNRTTESSIRRREGSVERGGRESWPSADSVPADLTIGIISQENRKLGAQPYSGNELCGALGTVPTKEEASDGWGRRRPVRVSPSDEGIHVGTLLSDWARMVCEGRHKLTIRPRNVARQIVKKS